MERPTTDAVPRRRAAVPHQDRGAATWIVLMVTGAGLGLSACAGEVVGADDRTGRGGPGEGQPSSQESGPESGVTADEASAPTPGPDTAAVGPARAPTAATAEPSEDGSNVVNVDFTRKK